MVLCFINHIKLLNTNIIFVHYCFIILNFYTKTLIIMLTTRMYAFTNLLALSTLHILGSF